MTATEWICGGVGFLIGVLTVYFVGGIYAMWEYSRFRR